MRCSLRDQYEVLKDRQELKYAALDSWQGGRGTAAGERDP